MMTFSSALANILFGPRKPPSSLVRPFGRMLDAMKEKDPEDFRFRKVEGE